MFWLCNIGTLWASFHAFGHAPSIWVIAMGFWVGMLGNLLPLPGGVGGVDGAMIGAFSAFGVDFGLATVAVLVYRAFAFWLPTIPGASRTSSCARPCDAGATSGTERELGACRRVI